MATVTYKWLLGTTDERRMPGGTKRWWTPTPETWHVLNKEELSLPNTLHIQGGMRFQGERVTLTRESVCEYIYIYIYIVFSNPVDLEKETIPSGQMNYSNFEYLNIPGKELNVKK